jgi:hypothetical protein
MRPVCRGSPQQSPPASRPNALAARHRQRPQQYQSCAGKQLKSQNENCCCHLLSLDDDLLTWYFSMFAWKALRHYDFFAITGLAAQFALDTISGM